MSNANKSLKRSAGSKELRESVFFSGAQGAVPGEDVPRLCPPQFLARTLASYADLQAWNCNRFSWAALSE